MTVSPFRRPEMLTGRRACGGDERGFTLVEIITSIVVLGIMGIASTYLVIRLTAPRELTVRYEQRSLAARNAAWEIWGLFAQSPDAPPNECTQVSDPPPAEAYMDIDMNFRYAFRCWPYVENGQASDTLYQVRVWVQRTSDGEIVGIFDMLALLGGY